MFAWSALRTSMQRIVFILAVCCQDLRTTVHELLLNETLSFLRDTLTVSRQSRNRTESIVCS